MFVETATLSDRLEILKAKWLKDMMLGGTNGRGTINYKTTEARKNSLWQAVVAADPTKNKEYLNWMVRELTYANSWNWRPQKRYLEDLLVLQEELKTFDTLKKRNRLKQEHRDILKIDGPRGLYEVLEEYRAKEFDLNAKEIEQKLYSDLEATLIYNGPEWKIVIPRTVEASMFFGRNTRWCTAAKKNNQFSAYSKNGPLYIILEKKSNERYQLHLESAQLMDAADEDIEDIENLRYTHPGLFKVIRENIPYSSAKLRYQLKHRALTSSVSLMLSLFDVPLKDIKYIITRYTFNVFAYMDTDLISEDLLRLYIKSKHTKNKPGKNSNPKDAETEKKYYGFVIRDITASLRETLNYRKPSLTLILDKIINSLP